MTFCVSNITSEFLEIREGDHPYKGILNRNFIGSITAILIALTSILGNTAVVIVSFWIEELRIQRGNILIVYLALTDIMTAIFVMVPSAIAFFCDYWPFGKPACKASAIFNAMLFCSSSTNISLISIDRLIAVVFPLRYSAWMTRRLMTCFCGWLFLQSFVVGVYISIPDWITYDRQEGFCALKYTEQNVRLHLFALPAGVLCFVLPAVLMGVCNAVILYTAHRSKQRVQTLFVRRANVYSEMQMRKTIKSLSVLVITYYACYSPYAITKEMKVYSEFEVSPWLDCLITTLFYMASAANPFIYAIFRKDYRESFKKLLKNIVEKCVSYT